jgi:hypothetical protein
MLFKTVENLVTVQPLLNLLHAGVDCRRHAQMFTIFSKKFKIVAFHGHIQNQHENRIKMSTNKPSIGYVVLYMILGTYLQT